MGAPKMPGMDDPMPDGEGAETATLSDISAKLDKIITALGLDEESGEQPPVGDGGMGGDMGDGGQ